ncbi:hypothetical protein AM1_A0174 (plasmid) [Acaryochloris marina MBIC11017]|uniref:Uncharacterized protein n=1 Tax=Acaryochloris marina (strain MBIC 11017) TaxID=329726 RepID=A8ZKI1_ACAM1|nr:hypothetical protein AM1_A0174 [Acaryochloris marina MBIC11017]
MSTEIDQNLGFLLQIYACSHFKNSLDLIANFQNLTCEMWILLLLNDNRRLLDSPLRK